VIPQLQEQIEAFVGHDRAGQDPCEVAVFPGADRLLVLDSGQRCSKPTDAIALKVKQEFAAEEKPKMSKKTVAEPAPGEKGRRINQLLSWGLPIMAGSVLLCTIYPPSQGGRRADHCCAVIGSYLRFDGNSATTAAPATNCLASLNDENRQCRKGGGGIHPTNMEDHVDRKTSERDGCEISARRRLDRIGSESTIVGHSRHSSLEQSKHRHHDKSRDRDTDPTVARLRSNATHERHRRCECDCSGKSKKQSSSPAGRTILWDWKRRDE
jgi:hypothetical protein